MSAKYEFVKFPRTPHLVWLGPQSARDDKVMTTPERDLFLAEKLTVEEKVDGANVGVSVDEHGNLRAQNRGNWITRGGHAQFDGLWAWLDQRRPDLSQVLGESLILFGEWCLAVHTVRYRRLPDWFLGFDIYDRSEGAFLGVERRDHLFSRLGVASAPKLATGIFTIPSLKELLGHPSQVGGDRLEGLYLRTESNGWLKARAKIVRSDFAQAIDEHWSRSAIKRNEVIPAASTHRGAG